MARTLSSTMIGAMFAQQTGEIPLMLLEFVHDDITTLRFVNNTEDIESNGETYTAYPFKINIPPVDSEDEIQRVQVSIDNVDLTITQTIRGLTTSPTVRAALILASAPDDIEAGWYEFSLKECSYNALEVIGTLGFEDTLDESFPAGTFSPDKYQGLF